MSPAKAFASQRATDPFRLEHRGIADRLADFEYQIGLLPGNRRLPARLET